jgi:hypothetical protein
LSCALAYLSCNSESMEDNTNNGEKNKNLRVLPKDREEATKRFAQRGQWRTPPLPAFAACANGTPSSSSNNLPTTPDEYARMLQEAYKRGAEAGARARHPNEFIVPSPTVQYAPLSMTGPMIVARKRLDTIPAAPVSSQINVADYSTSTAPPAVPSGESRLANTAHSKSLPDMTSYQASLAHANDEEDKRKKRLARNRASARLRRLKKKNLVDSYEGEVGILESALSKLRSHIWGSNVIDHDALIEALSMERGQQPLTLEKRRATVQSILAQQREQVASLIECQLENWVLCTIADEASALSLEGMYRCSYAETFLAVSNNNEEIAQISSELKSLLNLTPRQLSHINQSSFGCAHEVQDLFTVDSCLQSIQLNEWLLERGVDDVAETFTSILNPNQRSKFLLWSDHNGDPIEHLDYVNVLVGDGNGPMFEFGVDEGLAEGD